MFVNSFSANTNKVPKTSRSWHSSEVPVFIEVMSEIRSGQVNTYSASKQAIPIGYGGSELVLPDEVQKILISMKI